MHVGNAIETKYRELNQYLTPEYIDLYKNFSNPTLQVIFSTLHELLVKNYEKMNTRLPTGDSISYFWAENSRELILANSTIDSLQRILKNTEYSFNVAQYYQTIIEKTKNFLLQNGGSHIPAKMEKIELYYTIPIFIRVTNHVEVVVPTLKKINHDYINKMFLRAMEDVKNGDFDSAATKSRTLLEEVFFYVIEQRQGESPKPGNINKLYCKVKDLYNMHEQPDLDQRINKLLSGLEKIVSAITELRNNESDAHGQGNKRKRIDDYHARLLVNSAGIMADFILSVSQKANDKN